MSITENKTDDVSIRDVVSEVEGTLESELRTGTVICGKEYAEVLASLVARFLKSCEHDEISAAAINSYKELILDALNS